LAILALVTLSCGLVTGDRDEDPAEESAAPQAGAEEEAAQEAAPEEAVSENDLGEEYRSLEGGYAFRVVPGFELEEFFGLVSMQAPGADPDVGPFFMLIGGSNDETKTNLQLLDDFEAGLDESGEVFDTQDIQIDGLPGIMVDFKGVPEGKEALGRVAWAGWLLWQSARRRCSVCL